MYVYTYLLSTFSDIHLIFHARYIHSVADLAYGCGLKYTDYKALKMNNFMIIAMLVMLELAILCHTVAAAGKFGIGSFDYCNQLKFIILRSSWKGIHTCYF